MSNWRNAMKEAVRYPCTMSRLHELERGQGQSFAGMGEIAPAWLVGGCPEAA